MTTTTQLLSACMLSMALLASPAAFARNHHHNAPAHAGAQCGPHTSPSACQKEAAAVRDAERRGHLTSSSNYEANALLRCDRLPGDQKDTCRKRISQGKTSGSVEAGGTITELREIVPAN